MIATRELHSDVLAAGRGRIKSVFDNGLPVYVSFSGGKDSLVLLDLVLELGKAGRIDLRQARVEFIDEEAIFPCVEQTVMEWRARCLALGVPFLWYCLEVRHYSCLNQLECDESFICWDRLKADVWVRQPPPFAIRSHPRLKPRGDTYQQFLARIDDGPHINGCRITESVQRRYAVAAMKDLGRSATNPNVWPLFDWDDDDVWLYLASRRIEVPDAYRFMYQLGTPRRRLRISQFFSVDTAPILARITEYYPHLMERILAREPTAYLVSLYWDSEMFRRSSPRRRAQEARAAAGPVDYRARVIDLLRDAPRYFQSKSQLESAKRYYRFIIEHSLVLDAGDYRTIYETLVAGDPKARAFRAHNVKVRLHATRRAIPGFTAAASTLREARPPRGGEAE
jgi:predicted phosphoadenosine phosphosulfate sulfurtransferase